MARRTTTTVAATNVTTTTSATTTATALVAIATGGRRAQVASAARSPTRNLPPLPSLPSPQAAAEPKSRPLLAHLLETQMFSYFEQKRSESSDPKYLFFDSCLQHYQSLNSAQRLALGKGVSLLVNSTNAAAADIGPGPGAQPARGAGGRGSGGSPGGDSKSRNRAEKQAKTAALDWLSTEGLSPSGRTSRFEIIEGLKPQNGGANAKGGPGGGGGGGGPVGSSAGHMAIAMGDTPVTSDSSTSFMVKLRGLVGA